MAYLKETKVDGDLYVEGGIYSKTVSTSASSTGEINFPIFTEAIENSLIKFTNDNGENTSSKIVFPGDNTISSSLDNSSVNMNFNGDVSFNNIDSFTYENNIGKTNSSNSEIVLLYESEPQSGDYYTTINGKNYSTRKVLNKEYCFQYKDKLNLK